MEKARVAAQVRISHLKKQGREDDEETKELFKRIRGLEAFVDGKLKRWTEEHPTSAWWQRISGVYLEPMGKFIGLVDSFGRYYAKGDPMIPAYVKREPVADGESNNWIWEE